MVYSVVFLKYYFIIENDYYSEFHITLLQHVVKIIDHCVLCLEVHNVSTTCQ